MVNWKKKNDLELKKEKAKINKDIKEYENDLLINEKYMEQNNIFFDSWIKWINIFLKIIDTKWRYYK